ncbi:MAG: UDP-N-acetylmuramoyl-L-alanyl-D-glutamate--2,6-diaminopimelate ligase [Chlamydiales bacterium]
MKIKKIIQDLPVEVYKGSRDIDITALCAHSKYVAPGNLFIAKRGKLDDGAKYIDEAIAAGAVAILSDLPDPSLRNITQLICADVRKLEAQIAARFYGDPSKELFTIGVTGTNGKTTTTYMIKHLLDALGGNIGLIGTIEYVLGKYHFDAELTTPDILTNQKLLREMVKYHCDGCAMEVSSHGLVQGRVEGIDYDVALFTNLTQDHLDYHKSMEGYAGAKRILFQSLKPEGTAIVNLESPWGEEMLKGCRAHTITYGFSNKADLFADDIQLSSKEAYFTVHYRKESVRMRAPIVGRFNVLNILGAVATALVRGHTLVQIAPCLENFPCVRGRFERVENSHGLEVYVDFAHTPDALEKVLSSLAEFKKSQVLLVFGAGGDRDREKRAQMGRVASKWADFSFITSDNPRSEDPLSICKDIVAGFEGKNYLVEVDRRAAIEKAILQAGPGDLLLIAGKGHETYQTFAHQTIPFDDRKVAYEILSEVRCV